MKWKKKNGKWRLGDATVQMTITQVDDVFVLAHRRSSGEWEDINYYDTVDKAKQVAEDLLEDALEVLRLEKQRYQMKADHYAKRQARIDNMDRKEKALHRLVQGYIHGTEQEKNFIREHAPKIAEEIDRLLESGSVDEAV